MTYRKRRDSAALDESFLPAGRRVHGEWNKSERRRPLNTRRPTKTFELHQLTSTTRVTGNEHLCSFYCDVVVAVLCDDIVHGVRGIRDRITAVEQGQA